MSEENFESDTLVEDPEGVEEQDEFPSTDIAIIGMAGRFPGATTVEALWANLCAGEESIHRFSDEELLAAGVSEDLLARPEYVKARGRVPGVEFFDAPFFGLTPREAEVTDPQHRLFLECAWEALETAGYDPGRYDGLVGVFAGAGANTYVHQNLASNPDRIAAVGTFQTLIGNDKDHLTTQVSYRFDLKGPSVTVQTACSSSLVAVHLACSSLAGFDCEMALAGGVSVSLPHDQGYLFEPGGISSPDGHCRAFDAAAGGTVPGSGAGVVVLKRLSDALADGDSIVAVLRGTAVNNDGAGRAGYTAPSAAGQAEVIAAAQALADVEPHSISYIEAHGTGTVLGDPIEVSALTEAFRAEDEEVFRAEDEEEAQQVCALGSVKSNLGHLDTASGVAGLIKAALAVERGVLPPTLHFQKANPALDLPSSPFFVNGELQPWQGVNGWPRRAGVSSFGIGGTNAHVVLEEAPPRPEPGPSRRQHLITLSARSPAALDALTRNLGEHLKAHPELCWADVSLTLNTGRKRFNHRRVVVAESSAQAAEKLLAPETLPTSRNSVGERPVFFLFPGQGAQHLGMAQGLYDDEPVFQREIDRAAEILEPILGLDLRRAMAWGADAQALNHTALAQPTLFAVEYSLAQLWRSWGVEPAAMLGHSLGEYVAACLAGVFTLEEALTLVAERGRLMAECPSGSMLSVSRSPEDLQPLLQAGSTPEAAQDSVVNIAAVNGPQMSVVGGPPEEMEALEARLTEEGVEFRRLHTSHAFHSTSMEPVVEVFAQRVAAVGPRRPERPFLSNVTGTWIEDEEAMDPAYWGRHLRQPVLFSKAVLELLGEEEGVFLEVGPGQGLGSLVRRHPEARGRKVLASLPPPKADAAADSKTHQASMLSALGRLWLAGVEPHWTGLYDGEERRRLPLPTYPFERHRHWVDAGVSLFRSGAASQASHSAETAASASAGGGEEAPATSAVGERPDLDTPYSAPRDDGERRLAEIWQRILGIAAVGVQDNFFELGGHSLLATRLAAHLREEEGVEMTLADLFESPTVASLAAFLKEQKQTSEGPVASAVAELPRVVADPEHRYDPFPLTDIQQAYWLGRSDAFELGNVATHIYDEMEVGALDAKRLERAWGLLIQRHEMLRAVFLPDGRQRILEEVPAYEIGVLDLTELPPGVADERLSLLRQRMSHQVLDAERWPLFDLWISRRGPQSARLHFSFDILIADAWSWGLLMTDLFRFYQRPEDPHPPLELSFRDYVLAEEALRQSDLYGRSWSYWQERLGDFPPAPELPLVRSPETLGSPHFVRRGNRLSKQQWQRLRARGARAGLTSSGILLAAFAEVLEAWSHKPQFAINLTLFNRLPLHPQVNEVVGDFTSLTLLAIDGSQHDGFEARARRVQKQLWSDLEHRYVSGVTVMRELARQGSTFGRALMPVVFTSTLNLGDEAQDADDESTETSAQAQHGISQTPQVWLDHQAGEEGGALVYNWDAVDDLFPPGLLDAMLASYQALLERLASEEEAWHEQQLALVPEEHLELHRGLQWQSEDLQERRLEDAVHAAMDEHPHALAVVDHERSLTHRQLWALVQPLAATLRERGAQAETLVAVVLEKGWRQAVAVLAVLEAGAAYLPIDPSLPAERLEFLLDHGQAQLVITHQALVTAREWPEDVHCLVIDEEAEGAGEDGARPNSGDSGDLAYVIYTSGSTGRPKGVMIEHRAAWNTIDDINRRFAVGPEDRVLSLSSLGFDLSVYDHFGPLAVGGSMVLPGPQEQREPARWLELMERHGVTLWNTVPALLSLLVDHAERHPAPEAFRHLRLVLLSGDWIPVELPDRLRALRPADVGDASLEIVSLGGATEAAIWSIIYPIQEVDPSWASIPYGTPLRGQGWAVLDHQLERRPPWVAGELFISGAGLARGYWRDEAKTNERFIEHPRTGERLYRTGDLGRLHPSGHIEFLGREDFQVKVQGHRIELGEIEATLLQLEAVAATVVLAVGERQGGKRLVACVVLGGGRKVSSNELEDFLAGKLPAYMVPKVWRFLEKLPLTGNGKVDRRALEDLAGDEEGIEDVAPSTETEQRLARIWCEVLGLETVSARRSFYELGGDSLLAVRVLARLREVFRVDLTLRTLFEAPVLAELAARIDQSQSSAEADLERRLEAMVQRIEELSESEVEEFLVAQSDVQTAQTSLETSPQQEPG